MTSTNAASPPATTKITSFFAATAAKTTTQQLNNTNTEQQQQFRLESCSPQGLVDALVAARGKDEASRILEDAFTILAGGTVAGNTTVNDNANVGDATMVSPNEKRSSLSGGSGIVDGSNNKDKDSSNDNEKLLGRALLSEPIETSFLSPRMGKFSLQLHEHGLVATKLNDPTVKFIISEDNGDASSSSSAVSHVLLFPKPEDCKAIVYNRKLDEESKPKKVGGNLVVLRLGSPVHLPKQKSPTQQLCFALPGDKKLGTPIGPSLTTEGESSSSSSCDPTEAWGRLLHRALGGRLAQVLGKKGEGAIGDNGNKNNYLGFKSYQPPSTSTTTAGMPFVSCYLGVNDGVLYPLEEGLLFYKPPRFLPRSNLHSIACGRGGGGDSSRYVDMVVQCSDNNNNEDEDEQIENIEFTNIQREENSVLNSYIHDVLVPAMTNDAKEHADGSDDDSDQVVVEAIAEEGTDDDATEDEDDDQVEEVQAEDSDQSNSDDDYDEDFEGSDADSQNSASEGNDSDSSDGEGIAVVRDDFAQELVNEKRKKREEESATESEDEDSSSGGRRRISKRLRQTGA